MRSGRYSQHLRLYNEVDATVGSGQTGAIDEELFEQIIASFRLTP